jgi:hypothetical protein
MRGTTAGADSASVCAFCYFCFLEVVPAGQLIKNDDGTFSIVETKKTSTTRQSKGQNAAESHVNKGNGVFETRTNQPSQGLKRGDKIKVKDFIRKNKYD